MVFSPFWIVSLWLFHLLKLYIIRSDYLIQDDPQNIGLVDTSMIKRFSLFVILFLFVGNGLAQNTVSLANGRLTFEVPRGFRAMTSEEIALKFPKASPPQYVYANERGGVSIAVTFSQAVVPLERLPALKSAMEQMLPRMTPGLKWISRETVEINGQPWIHLEMTSSAVDTDIHNHMYLTAFDGRMLGINMNSTVKEYKAVAKALVRSRNSIRVVQ